MIMCGGVLQLKQVHVDGAISTGDGTILKISELATCVESVPGQAVREYVLFAIFL